MPIFKGKIKPNDPERLTGEIKEIPGFAANVSKQKTLDAEISHKPGFSARWSFKKMFSAVITVADIVYRFFRVKRSMRMGTTAKAIAGKGAVLDIESTLQNATEAPLNACPVRDVAIHKKERLTIRAALVAYRRAGLAFFKRFFFGVKATPGTAPGTEAAFRKEIVMGWEAKAAVAGSEIIASNGNTVETGCKAAGASATAHIVPAVDNTFSATHTAQPGKAAVTGANISNGFRVGHSATITLAFAVEFLNYDGTLLYTAVVRSGESCHCPVEQGEIEAPTRASDAQYHYTAFTGWSFTNGGDADESALTGIVKPTKLYAAYEKELRQYTVSFYDGETLLHSVVMGYGEIPEYTPKKAGYEFIEWTPGIKPVSGNVSYYAVWEEAAGISGTCGSNATWVLSEDGVLTISGTGSMTSYYSTGSIPWYEYKENIVSVVIEDGITSVGYLAFNGLANLAAVTLPETLKTIGGFSFVGTGITELTIPDSVTEIGGYAFSNKSIASKLQTLNVTGKWKGYSGSTVKVSSGELTISRLNIYPNNQYTYKRA